MFEDEYRRWANHPDYQSLFKEIDLDTAVTNVHDGYFSIDKKGAWADTAENNQGNRDNAERAYSLIMKDKEKLLSFDTPLKFIFSHSALREGWDNPRVQFDNEKLLADCAQALRDSPPISKTRVNIRKADLTIGRGGVSAAETVTALGITGDGFRHYP